MSTYKAVFILQRGNKGVREVKERTGREGKREGRRESTAHRWQGTQVACTFL